MELDKRPTKGRGLLFQIGTALLLLLAIAALSTAITIFILLRQAKEEYDREQLRGQQQADELRKGAAIEQEEQPAPEVD